MTTVALRKPSSASAPYWGMLKGLSKPVKIELVALLSDSVAFEDEVVEEPELTEEEKDRLFESLAGCWADDPEDAARMEAAVRECHENDVLREVNTD